MSQEGGSTRRRASVVTADTDGWWVGPHRYRIPFAEDRVGLTKELDGSLSPTMQSAVEVGVRGCIIAESPTGAYLPFSQATTFRTMMTSRWACPTPHPMRPVSLVGRGDAWVVGG